MRFAVNVDYPLEKMEKSKERMQAWERFAYVDRVPVMFCVEPRFFAPLFKINYTDFFRDVETQYELQLEFFKYRVENIPEDFCLSPEIPVYPYFDNVITASAFGSEIHYPDNETLQAVPVMKKVDEIDVLNIPEPDAGLWGTMQEWWWKMRELAEQTEVTFNGKTKGRVVVSPLTDARLGPHMIAVDLAGENVYAWMLEYPEMCHKLLDKITKGIIQAESHFRRIDPRPRGVFGLAEDSIQICSPQMYRDFCVPYDDQLFDQFGVGLPNGRGMHMCGDSSHLLESLVEDGRISSFNLFGDKVPPELAADKMGGKVRLWGNLSPLLLLRGTKQDVKDSVSHALRALAPRGGCLLGDGANVCPATPIENLAAIVETAEEYGLPQAIDSNCERN